MYLHIGSNQMVLMDDIVAIIAIPNINGEINKKHPAYYLKTKQVININLEEKPKSYVITKNITYISPISIKTLGKRVKKINNLHFDI